MHHIKTTHDTNVSDGHPLSHTHTHTYIHTYIHIHAHNNNINNSNSNSNNNNINNSNNNKRRFGIQRGVDDGVHAWLPWMSLPCVRRVLLPPWVDAFGHAHSNTRNILFW